MRWGLLAALLVASLSAQTTVPVTVRWDVDAGDTGVSAELTRDGQPVPCAPVVVEGATARSCRSALPLGPARFALRMVNASGGAGPWLEADAVVVPGAAPGAFTLLWHRLPASTSTEPEPDPMPNFVDAFTRANSATLGALSGGVGSWSEHDQAGSGINIVSNQVGFSGASGESYGVAQVDTQADGANHHAQIAVQSLSGAAAQFSVFVRRSTATSDDGYQAYLTTSGVTLMVADTEAELGTYSFTPSFPVTVRLEANGTTIRVLIDGVQRISVTNSAHTTGRYVGIGVYGGNGATALADNFDGGDPPSGGGGGNPWFHYAQLRAQ